MLSRAALLAVLIAALAAFLPPAVDSAEILSSIRVRRGPLTSSTRPSSSTSKLVSSISRALDGGSGGIGIPSVDQIIKSTSTLSATPSDASTGSSPSVRSSRSSSSSAAGVAAASNKASDSSNKSSKPSPKSRTGPRIKKRPNKVTVISNLNVMQHNEEPPQKADLVALSEQNSKTQQEHRQKQMDAENRDVRREQSFKVEHSLNEEDTKADIADSNAQAAEQNRKAADEANNKHTAVLSAEQTQKTSTQNFNEMQIKQKSQQDEQTAKGEAGTKTMAQAAAEQQSKSEQLQKANVELNQKAAAESQTKANEQSQKKQQQAEQQQKTTQEQQAKSKYILTVGPIQPTRSFKLRLQSAIAVVPQWAYMFWIKPLATTSDWASILHHGNTDSDRNPSVLFYPGSSRLHIRSGSKENWNGGFDPSNPLPMQAWSHIALVHTQAGFSVYLNGVSLGQDNNSGPLQKAGDLYCSSPWYAAAQAQLADIRYFDRFVTPQEVQQVQAANKHP